MFSCKTFFFLQILKPWRRSYWTDNSLHFGYYKFHISVYYIDARLEGKQIKSQADHIQLSSVKLIFSVNVASSYYFKFTLRKNSSNIKTLETQLWIWQLIIAWIFIHVFNIYYIDANLRQKNKIPSRSYPTVFVICFFFLWMLHQLTTKLFQIYINIFFLLYIKTLETQLWIWQLIIAWILHVFNIYYIDAMLKEKNIIPIRSYPDVFCQITNLFSF